MLKLIFVEDTGNLRRPRALWRLISQLMLFVAVLAIVMNLLTLWGGLSKSPRYFPYAVLTSVVVALVAVTISMWLVGKFLDRRRFRDFGFHLGRKWWLDLGFGMSLGALLMVGIFFAQSVLGWARINNTLDSSTSGMSFGAAILFPAALFVCIGIYEEMFYRGYQLKNIAESLNFSAIGPRVAVVLALVLSSTAFGMLHATNPNASIISTFNITLAGMMLGFGYVLTGELAISIGLHITWNFFQGNVFGFPVSGLQPIGASFLSTRETGPDLWTGGTFGPEAGLLGIGAMILGSVLIYLWVRLRQGKVAILATIAESPRLKKNSAILPLPSEHYETTG